MIFNALLNKILRKMIQCYQFVISPILPMSCRFYPSCSEYACIAIEQYGCVKGLWKSISRLSRCHPWAEGGFDPVSFNKEKK